MKKLAMILCGFVAASGLVACENGDNPNLLNIQIKKVVAEVTHAGADKNPDALAMRARITVTGPGMDTVSKDTELGYGGGTLRMPEFTEGYDRQVTFEFLGAEDVINGGRPVIGRGRTASLDIWADKARAADRVFVAPVNSMVRPSMIDEESGTVTVSVPFHSKRVGATMTELDDGRVLICGGAEVVDGAQTWYMPDDLYNITDTCETYDPRTGIFSEVPTRMNVKRAYHQAIKLGSPKNPDGRVVIIGGYTIPAGGTVTPTPLIDIYNPETGLFINATDGKTGYGLPGGAGRALFTADLINADDNVIIVWGGLSDKKAAGGTYDILWITEAAAITLGHASLAGDRIRYNHTMLRVTGLADKYTDNRGIEAYLLIGGENESGTINDIEPYAITCSSHRACKVQRQDNVVRQLPDGGVSMARAVYDKYHNFVFIVGGFKALNGASPTRRVEIFRVTDVEFRANERLEMSNSVGDVKVAEMDSGKFLLTGGWNGSEFVDAVQVLSPKGPYIADGKEIETPTMKSDVPAMESARGGHSVITDQTGRVLILGGVDNNGAIPDPIMYNPLD